MTSFPIDTFSLKQGVKPVEKKSVATQTDSSMGQDVICACKADCQSKWKKNLLARHRLEKEIERKR